MVEENSQILKFGYQFTKQGPRTRVAAAITKNNDLGKVPGQGKMPRTLQIPCIFLKGLLKLGIRGRWGMEHGAYRGG